MTAGHTLEGGLGEARRSVVSTSWRRTSCSSGWGTTTTPRSTWPSSGAAPGGPGPGGAAHRRRSPTGGSRIRSPTSRLATSSRPAWAAARRDRAARARSGRATVRCSTARPLVDFATPMVRRAAGPSGDPVAVPIRPRSRSGAEPRDRRPVRQHHHPGVGCSGPASSGTRRGSGERAPRPEHHVAVGVGRRQVARDSRFPFHSSHRRAPTDHGAADQLAHHPPSGEIDDHDELGPRPHQVPHLAVVAVDHPPVPGHDGGHRGPELVVRVAGSTGLVVEAVELGAGHPEPGGERRWPGSSCRYPRRRGRRPGATRRPPVTGRAAEPRRQVRHQAAAPGLHQVEAPSKSASSP